MPTKELRLRLDDALLAKARALAESQGSSLEDILVVYLTNWVREDKRRRMARAMMKPYVDRPTVSLSGVIQPSRDETEDEADD